MTEANERPAVIHHLALAEPEYRQRMLNRLDEIRAAVERGETIALFIGEIQHSREFLVTNVGDVRGLEALGLLHRMMHYVHQSFGEGFP